jgi:hypothetical protein
MEDHINRGRNYVLETGRRTRSLEKHWGMIYISCLFVESNYKEYYVH